MTKPPKYWNKAISYLSSKDKIMRSLIKKYNDTFLTTRRDVFFSLCKSIIGQQISVAAANSVFIKFKKLELVPSNHGYYKVNPMPSVSELDHFYENANWQKSNEKNYKC